MRDRDVDDPAADPLAAASAEGNRAIVVAKPRAQQVIDQLQAEGVYDADRHVRSYGENGVSIPVTAIPRTVEFREIVRQVGQRRLRSLEDHLGEMGWTDGEIERAPSSWAVIGTVILVELGDAPRPAEVGDALLALHGEADTVLDRGGITGEHREPDVEVIAGEGDTETIHTEHGTRYAMDLAEVMFSPGNKEERSRMGAVVAEDEAVLDMFAGIGYFTLPMARAGATVTAVERNPAAFQYLIENARLNDVTDRVRPYRADCRDVVEGVAVDRVVMGYYDADEYLDSALEALNPGGTLHLHEATPDALVFERPIERLEAAAAERDRSVEVLETRRVKTYSEGVDHVVVDATVH